VQAVLGPDENEAQKRTNPQGKVVASPSMDELRRPPGAAPGGDDMSIITIISKLQEPFRPHCI
jgi:hypothetical protein